MLKRKPCPDIQQLETLRAQHGVATFSRALSELTKGDTARLRLNFVEKVGRADKPEPIMRPMQADEYTSMLIETRKHHPTLVVGEILKKQNFGDVQTVQDFSLPLAFAFYQEGIDPRARSYVATRDGRLPDISPYEEFAPTVWSNGHEVSGGRGMIVIHTIDELAELIKDETVTCPIFKDTLKAMKALSVKPHPHPGTIVHDTLLGFVAASLFRPQR